MLPHNGILIRANVQACMLVADELNRRAQFSQVINVGRVGIQRSGKGLGLVSRSLVCVVENVL